MADKPRVYLHTLGCKVNQADTEGLRESLAAAGFDCVEAGQVAEVCVVNTCAVTREADHKSRQAIRRAARLDGRPLVVVTGCYAEISLDEIAAIPGVDLVVPQENKDRLVERVLETLGMDCSRLTAHCSRPRLRTRAFLKVQDGCDSRCTYCIVPAARGKPRSEPLATVIERAQRLLDDGAREIVLTGVHMGRYGRDLESRPSLGRLLAELLSLHPGEKAAREDRFRIRLSSVELEELTPEIVQLIRTDSHTCATMYGRVCRHVHVPLQSGSDEVLRRMGRRYTARRFAHVVEELKSRVPGIAVTTDVMVGFPGETEAHFEETRRLVERLELARLHVFKYSPRPGTPAAGWTDQVPAAVKKTRSDLMVRLGEELADRFRAGSLSEPAEVLVEKSCRHRLTGYTDNYLRVEFDGPEELVGRLVDISLGA